MMILDLLLGFLTAAGGVVDISNIVFNPQAGARFGYALLWPTVVGVLCAAVYCEMSGRVAAIAHKSAFDLIRERLGSNIGFLTVLASLILNILTCAAEAGGVAIILQLFSGLTYPLMLLVSFIVLLVATWFMSFKLIEWTYGFIGLIIGIYVLNALVLHPNWALVAKGFLPIPPHFPKLNDYIIYWYYAVGLIAAAIMPYEIYFYSSGGIEEHWEKKDLLTNYVTSYVGYGIGAIYATAITIVSAILFFPAGFNPQTVATAILGPIYSFGKIGMILALLGLLAAIAGTSVETALSSAYTLAQYFGWPWGKYQKPARTPRFTFSWILIFILAFAIFAMGINPFQLTQVAVIASVIALPFSYLPIFLVANDKDYMGKYANGKIMKILGWVLYGVIIVVAIVAVPLLIITNGGNG